MGDYKRASVRQCVCVHACVCVSASVRVCSLWKTLLLLDLSIYISINHRSHRACTMGETFKCKMHSPPARMHRSPKEYTQTQTKIHFNPSIWVSLSRWRKSSGSL